MARVLGFGGLLLLSWSLLGCGSEADDTDSNGGSGGSGAGGSINLGDSSSGNGCDGKLTGRVRDFSSDFPDMEPAHSGRCDSCDDKEIVEPTIGPDRKPAYAGGADGTLTTTGAEAFDQWFRDTPGVNEGTDLPLQFIDPDKDGVFTYDNQAFFPIDGQLLGNEGQPHNYHFTFELHTEFVYREGQEFTFIGDDDVFTFIDGKLVVNLGGVHGPQTGRVVLDELGLTPGQRYPLDFFFAERHVTESHFRIDTSIEFVDCGTIIR